MVRAILYHTWPEIILLQYKLSSCCQAQSILHNQTSLKKISLIIGLGWTKKFYNDDFRPSEFNTILRALLILQPNCSTFYNIEAKKAPQISKKKYNNFSCLNFPSIILKANEDNSFRPRGRALSNKLVNLQGQLLKAEIVDKKLSQNQRLESLTIFILFIAMYIFGPQ